MTKIVVIGGVAGGATAVARMRRLDEQAEIILLERGAHVSFANCGLPYYIGGEIENRDQLFVATKESINDKYSIDIRELNEAVKIDPVAKTVTVHDKRSLRAYEESYDKLLIATGSSPIIPKMPGIPGDRVFTLWNVEDTDRISNFILEKKPKTAVVVGAGFIGLEMAENLAHRGLQVTVVEKADQVMAPLDPDMAKLIENELADHGVQTYLGEGLSSISPDGAQVLLDTGRVLETDMVLLNIGVRPNSELAREAGLEMNARGGIIVNERMETSDPDIYAVGDVVEVDDFNTGGRTMVPLAGPANKQGRLVAANMLGFKPEEYVGTQGTSVARVFDLSCGSTGRNEKQLKRDGLKYGEDYQVTIIHPNAHAGYFPGALPLTLKMIYAKDGKVLGAQAVGYDGVDKRIDVLATAIHFGATVDDLTKLELAYAPPYSSAKDPVNVVGYTAENLLNELSETVSYEEFVKLKDDPSVVLLDIREPAELMVEQFPDSVQIPLSELRDRISELDPDKKYIASCQLGLRGYVAERVLKANGIKSAYLLGGFKTLKALTKDNSSVKPAPIIGSPAVPEVKVAAADATPEQSESDKDSLEQLELLNVCGLSCPGPIVQVNKRMAELSDGDRIEVVATDPGFARDIESWCDNTGNKLISQTAKDGKYYAVVQKGMVAVARAGRRVDASVAKEKTMIIFDGDLDRAIAAFIIATGAAAMGNQVNMFFTFWGLSVIRKPEKIKVKRDFMSKMFAKMLPRGSRKLKLSQMNMMGMGPKMIRKVMNKQGVTSLEDLIRDAIEAGVKITACQMSMDVMGLKKEELLDGVEVGGVASMLNDNDHSNMNLFI